MPRNNNKLPKVHSAPTQQKSPRKDPGNDPARHDSETIVWRFGVVDKDGDWGWAAAGRYWWSEIFPKMKHFETMTWATLMGAAGGRRAGNNHHAVKVEKLSRDAKTRLNQIVQEDVPELFSLRLDGTKRIYGIRDGRALKIIWFDPYHGDNTRAVYPVRP